MTVADDSLEYFFFFFLEKLLLDISCKSWGWSSGAKVLGKLSMPGGSTIREIVVGLGFQSDR